MSAGLLGRHVDVVAVRAQGRPRHGRCGVEKRTRAVDDHRASGEGLFEAGRVVELRLASGHGRRPRGYAEWSALARWGKLPAWEPTVPGYLLRKAREDAGLTQAQMAERLGVTQQAVACAERADANPSFRLLEAWGEALGCRIRLEIAPG